MFAALAVVTLGVAAAWWSLAGHPAADRDEGEGQLTSRGDIASRAPTVSPSSPTTWRVGEPLPNRSFTDVIDLTVDDAGRWWALAESAAGPSLLSDSASDGWELVREFALPEGERAVELDAIVDHDGSLLLFGSVDDQLRIWVREGGEAWTYLGPDSKIPSGRYVAAASNGDQIMVLTQIQDRHAAWVSKDGRSWSSSSIGSELVDVQPRTLVAHGGWFYAAGAGCAAAACHPLILSSRSGEVWHPVGPGTSLPGAIDARAGRVTALVGTDQGLVATGRVRGERGLRPTVWLSRDGLVWDVAPDDEVFAAQVTKIYPSARGTRVRSRHEILDIAADANLVVAVGVEETSEGPLPVVWMSTDSGETWKTERLPAEGTAAAATVEVNDREIVVAGRGLAGAMTWTRGSRSDLDELVAARGAMAFLGAIAGGDTDRVLSQLGSSAPGSLQGLPGVGGVGPANDWWRADGTIDEAAVDDSMGYLTELRTTLFVDGCTASSRADVGLPSVVCSYRVSSRLLDILGEEIVAGAVVLTYEGDAVVEIATSQRRSDRMWAELASWAEPTDRDGFSALTQPIGVGWIPWPTLTVESAQQHLEVAHAMADANSLHGLAPGTDRRG